MRSLSTALAAGIAPLLIAAQAAGQTPASPAQKGGSVSAVEKLVCKKFPPKLGSRIGPRTVCKTQVEWDLIRQEEYDALDRVQGRNATRGG